MKLNKYIAKSYEIEAIKILPSNIERVAKYISQYTICSTQYEPPHYLHALRVMLGKQCAEVGDFIVKINNEFKVVKGSEFHKLYQKYDKFEDIPSIEEQARDYNSREHYLGEEE